MHDALIQVVDEHDQPIGAATKQELWEQGLWHRIVRIIAEDGKGRILLQLRAPDKQPYPDCWDYSAAGHVDAGESEGYLAAAQRELLEELGIQSAALEEIDSYQSRTTYEWRKLNRFNKVYKVRIDPSAVRVDEPDIAEVRWFSVAEAKQLVAEHPKQITDGLKRAIEQYY